MALPDYSYLYDHACQRKGGEKALKALLPKTASKKRLQKLGSDRYLAEYIEQKPCVRVSEEGVLKLTAYERAHGFGRRSATVRL